MVYFNSGTAREIEGLGKAVDIQRSYRSDVNLSGILQSFHPALLLDGRQLRGRSGLIAVYVTCFDTELNIYMLSTNFYFVCA